VYFSQYHQGEKVYMENCFQIDLLVDSACAPYGSRGAQEKEKGSRAEGCCSIASGAASRELPLDPCPSSKHDDACQPKAALGRQGYGDDTTRQWMVGAGHHTREKMQ
jgi:hypothetical protein